MIRSLADSPSALTKMQENQLEVDLGPVCLLESSFLLESEFQEK
jgi:hypothetical protein